MEYRQLGKSGIKVSAISFGNWLYANTPQFAERTTQIMKTAYSLGINYFDTSEVYGKGEAEKQLGQALKELQVPRSSLIISTKVYWGPDNETNPNARGLSAKHIHEGVNNSLKRLDLEYIDIIYCHRYDRDTPMEETCRAFDRIIKKGQALYWGTSEWSAANIFEAFYTCAKYNLVPPVADQCNYNMMTREKMEKDFCKLFDSYGYGATCYAPLAGGLLTGKYNEGIPEDSRVKIFNENSSIQNKYNSFFGEKNKEKYSSMLKALGDVAKDLGVTQAQLALAWVLKDKDVASAITSATKKEQLEETVKAVEIYKKITPEIEKKIEEILGTRPDAEIDCKTWTPYAHRREKWI